MKSGTKLNTGNGVLVMTPKHSERAANKSSAQAGMNGKKGQPRAS